MSLTKKEIKACIFDLDGVIVDTAKYHYLAWKETADSFNIEFNEHDNEQLKGVSRIASLEFILNKGNVKLSKKDFEHALEDKNNLYLSYVSQIDSSELLPGVLEFLTELKEKSIKIGLGSASKNAQIILDRTGINSFFDIVIDGNKVTESKPNPMVFKKGADGLKISPSDIVVFEDALNGIEAAINGGFMVIGIGDKQVLKKAHYVITGFENFKFDQLQHIINYTLAG